MKKFSWVVLILVLVSTAFKSASNKVITGQVVDSGGIVMPGVNVLLKGTATGTITDTNGMYQITVPEGGGVLVFSFIGYVSIEKPITGSVINATMQEDIQTLSEIVVTGYSESKRHDITGSVSTVKSGRDKRKSSNAPSSITQTLQGRAAGVQTSGYFHHQPVSDSEEYEGITENVFHSSLENPLSTFSIDVDAASYSNVRRFINNGQRPPEDAVRIEEMINYFNYDYDQPKDEHPFNVITELSAAPWNENHKLVHIGLQGKKIPMEKLPASNLVFLIDVSGSMSDFNKLPLLKSSFKMLVEELRPQDNVAIVVYAGAAGLVLEPTSGEDKKTIIQALDKLQSGGSTAGGAGIHLAYDIAKKHFKEGGNNRVILATDGDFNVGESSNQSMEKLIEEKRKDGIFLTVLGFGMGNYKDSKMEILADKGNGNYAYIDNITEARKVLVNEFGGTLFTIAKDVKLQIEFNPAKVQAYRLIGYENRLLKDEDFNNDKKDAGELGSGHTVTALYEIIPVGVKSNFYNVDPLKYQKTTVSPEASKSDEWMTVKFRYKAPDKNTSKLIVHPVADKVVALDKTSDNFRWSAAVASFGMLLRESEYVNGYSYDEVVLLAQGAKGEDKEGYRIELINMIKSFGLVASR